MGGPAPTHSHRLFFIRGEIFLTGSSCIYIKQYQQVLWYGMQWERFLKKLMQTKHSRGQTDGQAQCKALFFLFVFCFCFFFCLFSPFSPSIGYQKNEKGSGRYRRRRRRERKREKRKKKKEKRERGEGGGKNLSIFAFFFFFKFFFLSVVWYTSDEWP